MSIVAASSIEVFISILFPVLILGFVPGTLSQSAEQRQWYNQFRMRKSPRYLAIAPPTWLFSVVWTILYLLMTIAAFIVRIDGGVYEEDTNLWPLTAFWMLQVVLAFYTVFFFGLQWRVMGSIIVLLGLIGTIVVGSLFLRFSVWAAVFLYITAAWCLFALILSIGILFKLRSSYARKVARAVIASVATTSATEEGNGTLDDKKNRRSLSLGAGSSKRTG